MSRKNNPKKLLWTTIGFCALIASYLVPQATSVITIGQAAPEPGYYKVVSFSDGDTITVSMNGKEEKVRFIGVDTPEKHHPSKPPQCFSAQASAFTKQRITDQGGSVRLEADPLNDPRDRYNRLLRYVYLKDGTLLNKALIEQGYGFDYTLYPFQKTEEFIQAATAAQTGKHGLWAACSTNKSRGAWQTNALPQ